MGAAPAVSSCSQVAFLQSSPAAAAAKQRAIQESQQRASSRKMNGRIGMSRQLEDKHQAKGRSCKTNAMHMKSEPGAYSASYQPFAWMKRKHVGTPHLSAKVRQLSGLIKGEALDHTSVPNDARI
jgi:uncharacterized protein YfdQ (DUF2303 family)